MKKAEPTDDSAPLQFIKHPRDTILGASLVLEAMFPDLPASEINRLAPYLAQEFADCKSLNK